MIELINRQRKVSIDARAFQRFADSAATLVVEAAGRSVTVAFVSDDRIAKLNSEFRGKNSPTDVLSFPFDPDPSDDDPHFGDIVISAETAVRQAAENGLGTETEIKQLILHGLLHLAGYDHETDDGTMDRLELQLRKKLEIDS